MAAKRELRETETHAAHVSALSERAPRPLAPRDREPWPTFLRSMFRVGLNSFGGPVAQIGVMHQEAVERRGWLSDGQFMHLLNFANVLPGPEALEIAIHLGYLRRGVSGGVVAGVVFIWPGFIALTMLAWMYERFGDVTAVSGFLGGIRPIAVALIAFAALRLALKALKGISAYALMTVAFAASFALRMPFIVVLVACGLLGLWLARFKGPSLGRMERIVPVVLLIVALGAGFVFHPRQAPGGSGLPGSRDPAAFQQSGERRGPAPAEGRLVEIAWVNTKAALVTFGGAYTVLPFLREEMAEKKGWVTDRQVVDALALGETTPGPLICFGIFLSYLAGGLPGAVMGCIFLFLPSFLLVLGLGRHIERVETLPGTGAVLWGVSAGTLALILSLTAQVIPTTLADGLAAVVAAAAFLVLWRLRANILLTVAAGGILGLVRALVA